MKFTEEQYQKIVEAFDRQDDYIQVMKEIRELVISMCHYSEINQAILLAVPESREWAHDKFVEKEKEYRWIGKKLNINGKHMLLYKSTDGDVRSILVHENGSQDTDEALTESEIKAWGYNPEMFDREEVK
jgi:hypothetical protein